MASTPARSESAVSLTRRSMLESLETELAAKRRVVRLRRELGRSRSAAALLAMHQDNRGKVEETKRQTALLRGAHLEGMLKDMPAATEEEVGKLAGELMAHLAATQVDPSKRAWFKLFKLMDENGDGHITFAEFMECIRIHIGIPPAQLPVSRVQAVWHAIDLDGNGWMDVGEFGRFFRLGEVRLPAFAAAAH